MILGATIGLGAVGLTLTYSILGFANFAHGELITGGAYAALTLLWLLARGDRAGGSGSGARCPSAGRSSACCSPRWALTAAARAGPRARAVPAAAPARHDDRARDRLVRRLAGAAQPGGVRLGPRAPVLHPRDRDRAPVLPGVRVTADQLFVLALTTGLMVALHAAAHAHDARAGDARDEREPRAAGRHRHRSGRGGALDVRDRRQPGRRRRRAHRAHRPGAAAARLRAAAAPVRRGDRSAASAACTARWPAA